MTAITSIVSGDEVSNRHEIICLQHCKQQKEHVKRIFAYLDYFSLLIKVLVY